MPFVRIEDEASTQSPQSVPIHPTVIVLPLSFGRLSSRDRSSEAPTLIHGVSDAFRAFAPTLAFEAGSVTKLGATLAFCEIDDFAPERVCRPGDPRQNALGSLQQQIDALYRVLAQYSAEDLAKAVIGSPEHRAVVDRLRGLRADASERVCVVAHTEDATIARTLAQIVRWEAARDDVLAALYAQLGPVERSYRLLASFFENAAVQAPGRARPIGAYVFDADLEHKEEESGGVLDALEALLEATNVTDDFRTCVTRIVVPGDLMPAVWHRLNQLAEAYGVLAIGDALPPSVFYRRAHGGYPKNVGFDTASKASRIATVLSHGEVQLRERYWFEVDDVSPARCGFRGPASLVLAGCLARVDHSRASVASRDDGDSLLGPVRGVTRAYCEPSSLAAALERAQQPVITIDHDATGAMRFRSVSPSGSSADTTARSFTASRVLKYLEWSIHRHLAPRGERLTRDLIGHILDPIEIFLFEQEKAGTILRGNLIYESDEETLSRGRLDLQVEVSLRTTGAPSTYVMRFQLEGEAW